MICPLYTSSRDDTASLMELLSHNIFFFYSTKSFIISGFNISNIFTLSLTVTNKTAILKSHNILFCEFTSGVVLLSGLITSLSLFHFSLSFDLESNQLISGVM